MINYIIADLKRICHKKSFLMTVGMYAGLFLLMMFIYFNPTFTAEMYVAKTKSYLGFFPLFLGLIIFLSVYYDDFKSKSMQIAIGYGISRYKVVISKFVEAILLLLISGLCFGILIFAVPLLTGLSLNGTLTADLIASVLAEILRAVGYISISAVPVFYTQNAVNGTIFYVLLSSKTVMLLLMMLLGQEFLVNMVGDLTQYLYTAQLYFIRGTFVETGVVKLSLLVILAVYAVLPVGLSVFGFQKKELEF